MSIDSIMQPLAQVAALALAMAAHEAAHAGMAYGLGDPTAKMMGRLSLNPVKHIDPIGTILVPGFLMLTGSHFLFGWAKPVPVNYRNLRSKQDAILVSVAGVVVNLALAMITGFLLQFLWANQLLNPRGVLFIFLLYSVLINSVLAVFNLIPIPPLDGSHILSNVLPPDLRAQFESMRTYGFIILVVLLATGSLWKVMDFFIQPICRIALGNLAGIIS